MQNQGFDQEEIEIDLLDLFSVLLKKWKWIVLTAVIGLLGGLLYTGIYNLKRPALGSEEQLEQLKQSMTAEEIRNVENLYQTYQVLEQNVTVLQAKLASSQAAGSDYSGKMMERTVFIVTSDVSGMGKVFREMTLTSDDSVQLSTILFGDTDHTAEIPKYVFFSLESEEDSHISGTNTLMTLNVIGETMEKITAAEEYTEKRITSRYNEIKNSDSSLKLSKIGNQIVNDETGILSVFSDDTSAVSTELFEAEKNFNDFKTNYINKLTGSSKTYFSYLSGEDLEGPIQKSYVKNGLIGLILGIFLAMMIIAIRYMFDGTVKTESELRWVVNGDTPYMITPTPDANVINKVFQQDETPVDMLAEDVTIKLKKLEKKKLYIIAKDKYYRSKQFQEAVLKLKQTVVGEVVVGDPLASGEELRKLSEADAAIIAVKLKNTKRNDVALAEQYCRNYNVPITGIIAL